MCGQHNVRATARDNTGQKTKDIHSSRIKITISDPAGSSNPAAGFEDWDSTDHATTECSL